MPGVHAVGSQALYRICQGMKVAMEIVLMTADAGLLDLRREVIAVSGRAKAPILPS
jgi:hypothetical protein